MVSPRKRRKVLESYGLLDHRPEPMFDDITSLVAQLCQVQISLVTILDEDKQYFKSHHGLSTSETPIEQSFCAHAVAEGSDLFIVEDAGGDSRFMNNPLVSGDPNITFYAGVPIILDEGVSVGTLCVMDTQSKRLDAGQKQALKTLAAQVRRLYEYNKSRREALTIGEDLVQESKRLSAILDATRVGAWEWNVQTGEVTLSERWAEIIGYTLEEIEPISMDTWYRFLHPDDHALSDEKIQDCFDKQAEYYDIECRMIHKDGHVVWINDRGRVVSWTEDGQPLIMSGTHTDITQKKNAEMQFNTISNNIPGVVFRYKLDPDKTDGMLRVSAGSYDLWGYRPEEVEADNMLVWSRFHTDDLTEVQSTINDSAQNLQPWKAEWRYFHPDGSQRWHKGSGNPEKQADGSIIWDSVILDVTLQKKEEERLRLMESVVTNTTDAILITDAELNADPGERIVYVNESFTKMTGYSPDEIIGKTPRIFQGAKTDQEELARLSRALHKQQPCELTIVNYKKSGEEFWVNFSVSPVIDANGHCTHFIAVERDVTAQKNAENEKKLIADISRHFNQQRSLKEALTDTTKLLTRDKDFHLVEIWLPDTDGGRLQLVAQHARGKSADLFCELSSHINSYAIDESFPGTVWAKQKPVVWSDIASNEQFSRCTMAAKTGFLSAFGVPLHHNLQMIGVLVMLSRQAIDQRHKKLFPYKGLQHFLGAEIRRKKQEEEMYLLFQSAPEILAIASDKGRFVKANPAFCGVLGYTEAELTAKSFEELIHPDDIGATIDEFGKNITGAEEAKNFVNRYQTKEGGYRWISWNSSDPFGEGLMFAFGRDITELKELQDRLDNASEMARVGAWEVDLLTGELYWSEMTREIFEVDGDFTPDNKNSIHFYHEHRHQEVRQHFERAVAEGEPFDYEMPVTTASDNEKWIRVIGHPEHSAGQCIRIFGSVQDIHDRKMSELDLLKFKQVIENSEDAISLVNPEGKVVYENPSMKQLINTGAWERDEKLPIPHQHKDEAKEIINTLMAGEYWRGDIRLKAPRKMTRTYHLTGGPVHNDQDELIAFYNNYTDITDRVRAENQLKRALNEKNQILESIGDGFFTVDNDFTVTYWNRMAEVYLSTPREKVLGKNLWDMFSNATDLPSYRNYKHAIRDQTTVHFEDYYEPLKRWFEISAYPSKSGLTVYFQDITQKKEALEQIRLSNERFEKVTLATNDAVWDWDVLKDELYWGGGFKTSFGYDYQEPSSSHDAMESHIHPEDRKVVIDHVMKALGDRNVTNWRHDYRYQKADGTYAFVIDRGVIIRNARGKAIRMVGAMTDITYRKEYENSLKELNEQLEIRARELATSNAELEQFAYVASHDLQEPLRMVTSFLSQLEKRYGDKLDEKAKKYIGFAVDGAKRMRQIILDLLEFSRVGKFDEEKKVISLNEVVEEVERLLHREIRDTGATIVHSNLPKLVTYHTPLVQIMQNLISNALKYSKQDEPPRVIINVTKENDEWLISINDNGIGIEPEYMERIFVIFQRLHAKDEYEGTGMGLAIVKKDVEFLGGRIWVESVKNQGSTFYFTLPYET